MTDRELMQQALAVLQKHVDYYDYEHFTSVCELEPAKDLILALRERLADNTIHSCSFHCDRPDCVKAQRDELRDEMFRMELEDQEPVAWGYRDRHGNIIDVITPAEHARAEGDYKVPLYTAPQQSEWAGLTDREFQEATDGLEDLEDCWKAIEAKLEEKNK